MSEITKNENLKSKKTKSWYHRQVVYGVTPYNIKIFVNYFTSKHIVVRVQFSAHADYDVSIAVRNCNSENNIMT